MLGALAPVLLRRQERRGRRAGRSSAWLASFIFVDLHARERRHTAGSQAEEVAGRLSRGDLIVLFWKDIFDGNRVLPFRPAARRRRATRHGDGGGAKAASVQPVAIAYTRMGGLPLGRQQRPHVALYGGMDLGQHLARVLAEGGIDVEVVFCPPCGSGRAPTASA